MRKNIVLLIISLGLLGACAVKAKYLVEGFTVPSTVALLPLSNQSNELGAPEIARKLMLEHLREKGYSVKPLADTDDILTRNGISEGGQLNAITPEKLGSELGVDGLVYGDVIEYNFINIGVYRNRVVEINFKILDPVTGDVIWEDERKVSNKEFTLDRDEIGRSFAVGLARKMIENVISSPLMPECKEVIRKIAGTLPRVK